jgi:AcrR family transcriptional regulator
VATSPNETRPVPGASLPSGGSLRVMPQQARGKDKLARVLFAADQIMAAEGVEAVTTVRVAAEAGVSVGSLYRYLPNREAILESLAQHYLGLLEDQMDVLLNQPPAADIHVAVGISIDAFADFYRTHPGFRALWFSRHLTEETRSLDRAHKAVMANRIRDLLIAHGAGRANKATLRISQTIQLTTDAVIQEAFRVNPRGDRMLLEQLKTMISSYLDSIEV